MNMYVPIWWYGRDIVVYVTCNDNLVKTENGAKHVDPLLKIYNGCIIMVTDNIDKGNKIANWDIGIYKGVTLKREHIEE